MHGGSRAERENGGAHTKAAIVGAGIAGLATAVALKKEKASCVVYERAPEVREVGAGLAIWANGVNALKQLGVKPEVMAAGSVVDHAITMNHRGKVLDRTDIGALGRRHGAECICVPRGELQRILLEATGAERIHIGANCVRVEPGPERVTTYFDDASCAAADFVVAADGMRSTIRKQLHPDSQPRFAGYRAWRGIVVGAFGGLPPCTTLLILARGCQAGIFPCGSNRVYWFATQNGASNPTQSPEGRKLAVLKAFDGWPAPFPEIIDATAPDNILENDILDLKPLDAWGSGRITFAGDSIHGMTPNLGQGAALALEDAVVLGRCIRNGQSIDQALRDYENVRRKRAAWIAIASRRVGVLLQNRNPIIVLLLRYSQSTRFAHMQTRRFLNQLFEFA